MRLGKASISAPSTIKPPTDAAKGAFYDTANRGLMERLKRCCAWLKGRLRYALCMIQSHK